MPLIPPIGDAYIDEIIKAVDPFDPSLNKTQGVKLRELIKLMRDRLEQQAAIAVAMQQTYTEVGSSISVSPTSYFDQPTTFIVNRNSGTDVVISFEDYAAEADRGKVYHIKNMGIKPAVVVSTAAALFDGEVSVTLPQFAGITIMSVTLTEGARSAWAIISGKGKAADLVQRVLALNINGLPGGVDIAVNGVVWPDREKAFPDGTVLLNLVITALGYIITPSSVPSVTMDADKTLTFEATEAEPQFEFSSAISWGDEFTVNGSPDSTKWNLDEGNGYYGWGNSEQQYYTNRIDNAVVDSGTLRIIAKEEAFNGFNFTSAKLNTRGKRMFQFGRFEIRAKLPLTGGMWPGIFMFGEDHQVFNLGSWPNCGEIDIMELNGNNSTNIHTGIHSGVYNWANGNPRSNSTYIGDASEDFNNFRIDWTPDYIRWFINDVQAYEFLNDGGDHSHWPFSDWFNLMITLSVGGNFVGPIDTGALPQTYELEYVRYYELLGGYETPPRTKPATPVVSPVNGVKLQSESLVYNVTEKPVNSTIKWYTQGGQAAEGDSFTFPPETPLGIIYGFVTAVDNITGVASEPLAVSIEVLP